MKFRVAVNNTSIKGEKPVTQIWECTFSNELLTVQKVHWTIRESIIPKCSNSLSPPISPQLFEEAQGDHPQWVPIWRSVELLTDPAVLTAVLLWMAPPSQLCELTSCCFLLSGGKLALLPPPVLPLKFLLGWLQISLVNRSVGMRSKFLLKLFKIKSKKSEFWGKISSLYSTPPQSKRAVSGGKYPDQLTPATH